MIGAEVAAQVAKVHVEIGDTVVANQLLVSLRDEPKRWQLEQAEAEVRQAQAAVEINQLETQRLQRLLKTKATAKDTLDQAQANLHQAEAALAAAKAKLAGVNDSLQRHQIRAPFDGFINARPVERGAWVGIGDPVIAVTDQKHLRLELGIPQHYFNELLVGTQADIQIPGLRHSLAGKISRRIPLADNSRSFSVWIELDNRDEQIIPGMSASALLSWQSENPDLMKVPRDAIIRRADGSTLVWKIESSEQGQQASPAPVIVQRIDKQAAIISAKQLNINDRVVVKGNENLRPKQTLDPVPFIDNSTVESSANTRSTQ
jgi:RND family efflux transporter MFP subunit